MHHAGVPLSYIGPDGQHLDTELNFACGIVAKHLNVTTGYKRCDVCEKLIRIRPIFFLGHTRVIVVKARTYHEPV